MKFKKIICVVLTLTLLLSALSILSYAEENENTQPNEYFCFIDADSNKRINSQGDFTFKFGSAVESTLFKPVRSSVTISCITSTTSGSWFRVTLYGPEDKSVGSFTAKDNGKEYSKSFNNLDTNKYYYFRLEKVNWANQSVIEGTGHVTNIY